jgi:membrane associated rhomboid family serine protease
MEPATARIPVRSRHQAMDWSLVLISQGIESTIDYSEDGEGWGLLVADTDYTAALAALRQYNIENRRRPWRQDVLGAGILFDWASLAWVFLVVLFFWLNSHGNLETAGIMDSAAVAHGQWWRLFTAMWLHADAGHLATNATIGLLLLGLVMGRYGTGVGLLAAYLAGAGGNVAAWLLSPSLHLSLGASGMVLGCLGLLAVQSFALWRQTPHAAKYIVTGIFAGVMLFVLLGLTPGTDVLAHAGGFVSGLLLGGVLSLIPGIAQRTWTNLTSGLVFAWLVVVPWWLALTRAAPPAS